MPGLRRLAAEELKEVEPHCVGVSALHSPETGIVNFADVARALADDLADQGVPVVTGAAVRAIDQSNGRLALGARRRRDTGALRRLRRGCARPTGWRCSPARPPTRASFPSAAAT